MDSDVVISAAFGLIAFKNNDIYVRWIFYLSSSSKRLLRL
ncbi:hypothetical protein VIBNISOn1_1820002 [Vibrio nigripulchritudo SOn1]|uniref:Uncharacterized protein n=1 Tax=Vibrio nigripulchritudo SOn1 TaxID=1238450 RepID=A0AAV2VPY6_9VIBR|nr:hypothetical protein VIBNISOn1_1820002 [Vibrio nigripulchritudo SOn1]